MNYEPTIDDLAYRACLWKLNPSKPWKRSMTIDESIDIMWWFSDHQLWGDLRWRDGRPITFYLVMNDIFESGTADEEDITAEDLGDLRRAWNDIEGGTTRKLADAWYGVLYAARRRWMRPQGAAYPRPESFEHLIIRRLLDASGPEREITTRPGK